MPFYALRVEMSVFRSGGKNGENTPPPDLAFTEREASVGVKFHALCRVFDLPTFWGLVPLRFRVLRRVESRVGRLPKGIGDLRHLSVA